MQGLALLRDDALRVAVDTAKPQPLRDEACGMIKTVEMILGLPDEIASYHSLLAKE